MLEVEQTSDGDSMRFRVRVTKGSGQTEHEVQLAQEDYDRLAQDHTPEELVDASFRFLLDREPKEQILRAFELPIIERYFPEYEAEISEYLT